MHTPDTHTGTNQKYKKRQLVKKKVAKGNLKLESFKTSAGTEFQRNGEFTKKRILISLAWPDPFHAGLPALQGSGTVHEPKKF